MFLYDFLKSNCIMHQRYLLHTLFFKVILLLIYDIKENE